MYPAASVARDIGASLSTISECAYHYTTTFENAHRTVLREVLYRHHPWFGRRVCVHETVEKADDVVFRCTLDGSQAERWREVPAWMFDRTACADAEPLTAQPFVSIDALAALSALLDLALKDRTPSVALLFRRKDVKRAVKFGSLIADICHDAEVNAGNSVKMKHRGLVDFNAL